MKNKLNLLFVAAVLLSLPVSSDSKINEAEVVVLENLKKDISEMKIFLNISTDYLKSPKDVSKIESLNIYLGIMRELTPKQINYYSSSLAIKNYFDQCLVFTLYTDIERYIDYMDQHKLCASENCENFTTLKSRIDLLAGDIHEEIASCEKETKQIL